MFASKKKAKKGKQSNALRAYCFLRIYKNLVLTQSSLIAIYAQKFN